MSPLHEDSNSRILHSFFPCLSMSARPPKACKERPMRSVVTTLLLGPQDRLLLWIFLMRKVSSMEASESEIKAFSSLSISEEIAVDKTCGSNDLVPGETGKVRDAHTFPHTLAAPLPTARYCFDIAACPQRALRQPRRHAPCASRADVRTLARALCVCPARRLRL